MPDVPPAPSLLSLAPLLGAAFLAGSVTQLTRQLAGRHRPRLRPTAALSVAAGIAALTVVALMTVTLPQQAAPALQLAAACITGWSGPGLLTRLGSLLERRLGLNAGSGLFDEK